MGRTLCVSGLPHWVSNAHLENLCERYGPVLATHVVKDAYGLAVGYGFVEMQTNDHAMRVIESLNGSEQFAWRLTVASVDTDLTEHRTPYINCHAKP